MTIEESNGLIAVFMGQKEDEYPKNLPKWFECWGILEPKDMWYHLSWDWLMPVVEKIESIKKEGHGYFGIYISSNSCAVQGTEFNPVKRQYAYLAQHYSDTKLGAAYEAVVEFIMWFNSQFAASSSTTAWDKWEQYYMEGGV